MDLQNFQARWTLDKLRHAELSKVASDMLVDGLDSESLRILAGLSSASDPEEIFKYFELSMKELKLQKLSKGEASLVLAKDIAKKIVSREIDPYRGARQIWAEACVVDDYPKELNVFIVDASDYEERYPKDPKILDSIVANAKRLIQI